MFSPYFYDKSGMRVVEGFQKLAALFQWTFEPGSMSPPKRKITHLEFLCILKGIRDSILPEEDPLPSQAEIVEARERFNVLLQRS